VPSVNYLDSRKRNPKLTVPKTVKAFAVAVRCAIAKGDCIAAVFAASSALDSFSFHEPYFLKVLQP
jgi:hypothetical protein